MARHRLCFNPGQALLLLLVCLTTFGHCFPFSFTTALSKSNITDLQDKRRNASKLFLNKRQIGQDPEENFDTLPENIKQAYRRGCNLVELMSLDVPGADQRLGGNSQSRWTDYADLRRYGWVRNALEEEDEYTMGQLGLSTAFEDLDIDETSTLEDGPNSQVGWVHDQDSTVDGVYYMHTTGEYQNTYNPEDGMIVAFDIFGPSYQKGEVPDFTGPIVPLEKWSDVVYLEWAEISRSIGAAVPLQYVFQTPIANVPTQDIIKWIMTVDGQIQPAVGWRDALILPGDSGPAKALLGSANGAGIAWLLINHKVQLGRRTVGEVILFWDDDNVMDVVPEDEKLPTLLFRIEDVA